MDGQYVPDPSNTYTGAGDMPPEPAEPAFVLNPACSICGRQDETVRFVIYPYVISLLVITYRRTMAGLWCRRHRNPRLILASVITSLIGWIGIPWGLLYTPLVLYRLARGGEEPGELNARIMVNMAGIKARQADYGSAVRCLETSLKYVDDESTRRQLRDYRLRAGSAVEPAGFISKLLRFAGALIAAGAIGAAIGIVNYLVGTIFGLTVKGEVWIYIVILSWAPLVVFSFLGGIALASIVEGVITSITIKSVLIAVVLAVVLALFAAYGIPEGAALSDMAAYLVTGGPVESFIDLVFTSGLVLFVGGYIWVYGTVGSEYPGDSIYLILIGIIMVYYLAIAVWKALQTIRWRQGLAT